MRARNANDGLENKSLTREDFLAGCTPNLTQAAADYEATPSSLWPGAQDPYRELREQLDLCFVQRGQAPFAFFDFHTGRWRQGAFFIFHFPGAQGASGAGQAWFLFRSEGDPSVSPCLYAQE